MPAPSSPTALLKYVVGIDIAKDTFVACFGRIEVNQHLRFGKEATFDNTPTGFAALLVWTAKQQTTAAPLWFVVEAIGVYYEDLAYFLSDNGHALSVLLPNKVKHFAQSTELKSKTDQFDARLAAAYAGAAPAAGPGAGAPKPHPARGAAQNPAPRLRLRPQLCRAGRGAAPKRPLGAGHAHLPPGQRTPAPGCTCRP